MKRLLCQGLILAALIVLAACAGVGSLSQASGTTQPYRSLQANQGKQHRVRKHQSPIYTVVYSFPQKNKAPENPSGPLYISSDGSIFGTTYDDWENVCNGECGPGAVFEVDPKTGKVSVIFSFEAGVGLYPESGVVQDASGALYGTTLEGGSGGGCSSYGCGLIYKLTDGASGWTQTVLHAFTFSSDGAEPSGPPLLINSTLYGLGTKGGRDGYGTVYKINTDKSGFTVLHHFDGSDGAYPFGRLITDATGTLYGVTFSGGTGSCAYGETCGTVFRINQDGSGFSSIYSFQGIADSDGFGPVSGLTLVNGALFGTTMYGGLNACGSSSSPTGCGTVYQLTPTASGYQETVLYKFTPTGFRTPPGPSGLLYNGSGTFYGTTSNGGSCVNNLFPDGCGTIFLITTAGSYETIHNFGGPPTDGANPGGGTPEGLLASPPVPPFSSSADFAGGAGLAVDATGTIWGATFNGGSGDCFASSMYGCGTVYKLLVSENSGHRH